MIHSNSHIPKKELEALFHPLDEEFEEELDKEDEEFYELGNQEVEAEDF